MTTQERGAAMADQSIDLVREVVEAWGEIVQGPAPAGWGRFLRAMHALAAWYEERETLARFLQEIPGVPS